MGQNLMSATPSITCPVCHRTSYNDNDIAHGYCGHCHDWTSPARDYVAMYVIYDHPKDFPNDFVCVRWHNAVRLRVVGTAPTLAEARSFVPRGLINLGRAENFDDPCIYEVWI